MPRKPKTFLVGYTTMHMPGLRDYLDYTGQKAFMDYVDRALEEGLSLGEILCSFYAKLCYKSLVLGMNENVEKIRDIPANIKSCIKVGHGSVFEHCSLNFLTTDCSRVFTHELVRHRVGMAFSQTSGRYVTLDKDLEIVLPPEILASNEATDELVRLSRSIGETAEKLREMLINDDMDFAMKKKITSAIRRIAPNGQTNEIGWSCNIRSLRHMIVMRTSRAAEWEIRHVFNEVARIVNDRFPLILHGAETEEVDGLIEYRNLRI